MRPEENSQTVKTTKVKNSLAVSKSKDGLTTKFKKTTTLIKDEPSVLSKRTRDSSARAKSAPVSKVTKQSIKSTSIVRLPAGKLKGITKSKKRDSKAKSKQASKAVKKSVNEMTLADLRIIHEKQPLTARATRSAAPSAHPTPAKTQAKTPIKVQPKTPAKTPTKLGKK